MKTFRSEEPYSGAFKGVPTEVLDQQAQKISAAAWPPPWSGEKPPGEYVEMLKNYYNLFPKDQRLAVLRAIDKFDKSGLDGVRGLLGTGRLDTSGVFNYGAQLDPDAIETVIGFMMSGIADRNIVIDHLSHLVGDSVVGKQGVSELIAIHEFLSAAGYGNDRVQFDPSIVRGLAYYTGPVFEAQLTFDIIDEDGVKRPFGSVAGGGRYDDLVKRFTGELVPATGASIGVDRLLAALKVVGKVKTEDRRGPVVVTVMDKPKLAEYQQMVFELRRAGVAAELYLGEGGFKQQLKYADRRNSPVAVIAGSNEFEKSEITIKNLRLGKELAKQVASRDEWRKGQPAQTTVARAALVEEVKKILNS
ncbi:MAG: histidine--tRNA ligase family protein [Planctomycetes bacterium]|nr:histidine--tRNA ligase family protein [Planctomycetota bacterium]